jgi:hypothetical protein
LIYIQRLEEQQHNDEQILQLADNMASIIHYIEDIEQFARVSQLKKAMEDICSLIEETTNFTLRYTSRSGISMHSFIDWGYVCITLLVATVKEAVLSSSDHSQIQNLQSRFELFRQQFDRGVSVQSALNLEALLTEIGTGYLFKSE